MPQWIIELEAPVDVTALLRDREDEDTAIVQAQLATQVLDGAPTWEGAGADVDADVDAVVASVIAEAPKDAPVHDGDLTLEHLLARAQAYGIAADQYQAYADRRWGRGWRLNPHGRRRAWDELDRYRNDPQGYLDKIESELHRVT